MWRRLVFKAAYPGARCIFSFNSPETGSLLHHKIQKLAKALFPKLNANIVDRFPNPLVALWGLHLCMPPFHINHVRKFWPRLESLKKPIAEFGSAGRNTLQLRAKFPKFCLNFQKQGI